MQKYLAGTGRYSENPLLATIKAKEKGLFVIQHSCGDSHAIFDDLIEIGLDCYQTFQPEIYDIENMKKIYSLYGIKNVLIF